MQLIVQQLDVECVHVVLAVDIACRACAKVFCAFCAATRARSALSASAALSLVALSAASRCCSGVLGCVLASAMTSWIFMCCLLSAKSLAFLLGIYLADINNCMNVIKQKPRRDLLSHTQHAINVKQREQTIDADTWLRTQGINAQAFTSIHPTVLKAQQAAHHLLVHHQDLLTHEQRQTLKHFQQQINNKHTREKLSPKSVRPILNIHSKINRKLFQLAKTANT
jgi:hypothetical protein